MYDRKEKTMHRSNQIRLFSNVLNSVQYRYPRMLIACLTKGESAVPLTLASAMR
jgi:hypothetical protein